jgi:hypothetical protein
MRSVTYSMGVSLDGYIVGPEARLASAGLSVVAADRRGTQEGVRVRVAAGSGAGTHADADATGMVGARGIAPP